MLDSNWIQSCSFFKSNNYIFITKSDTLNPY
ncbi:unnamed protein product [Staphylococcus haemolyticus JCSC1435]|uniref:Uncharacterized protein n=1 Tax=Staphylococcus haemolyticus (strain JCSC1435) TaxID=279808 RepID=Q4L8V0_STAHJ|nr:unnamed protein product [Staphylococcus haemolyticus JCSC1435]